MVTTSWTISINKSRSDENAIDMISETVKNLMALRQMGLGFLGDQE